MKKLLFILICACLALVSCMEKDFFDGDKGGSDKGNSTDFSFQSTTGKILTVYTRNPYGTNVANVPVSIYVENPYDENGNKKTNLSCIAYGVTSDNGALNIELSKIPNGSSELYVLTDWSGFGGMQVYDMETGGDIILKAPQFEEAETKAVSRAAEDGEKGYEAKCISKAMNLYSYLKVDEKGRPIKGNNGLVDDINLSNEFSKLVSDWYPESKNVGDEKYLTDPQYCTDMEIKDEYGCEIWVTYLGDGGFSNASSNVNIRNMLCYYQYDTNHSALKEGEDSKKVHKTIIFNNTNQREMWYGCRVQLLYWNGEEYVKVFPQGTHIGWALIQEGYNNKEYNMLMINDVNKYRFSTLELSTVGKIRTTQGIARWSEQFNCNIVGMENREIDHRAYDGDYNDILFRVDATPVIKPDVDVPVDGDTNPDKEIKKAEVYGTIAFEDMFPHKGDWDHNDFIADYTYTKEQSVSTGKIKAIVIDIDVRALGATRDNGFGIELPIEFSNVARVIGASLESIQNMGDRTSICIKNSTRELFNNASGIINTYQNIASIESSGRISLRVEMKKPISDSEVLFSKFNPFIFVGGRENEIHLPDYKPTSFGQVAFGFFDDATDGIKSFYKTNEGHAWGLDIPRINAETSGWLYPLEDVSINVAYPEYEKWVASKGNEYKTWYSNPNKSKVYLK